jgi:hypothetical protein
MLGLWGLPSDLGLNIKSINAFAGFSFSLRIGLGLEPVGLTVLWGLDWGLMSWQRNV